MLPEVSRYTTWVGTPGHSVGGQHANKLVPKLQTVSVGKDAKDVERPWQRAALQGGFGGGSGAFKDTRGISWAKV